MKMTSSTRLNLRLQNFTTGILAAGLLGLLAWASERHQVRWDWTQGDRQSLAEQSVKAVAAFPGGLAATVYVQEQDGKRRHAEELLGKYRIVNPDLAVRYVDPDLDPAAARAEDVAVYGTVVLRAGEKKEKLTELSEEAMTNALIRLAKGESKSIRFVSGHGEHPLAGEDRSGFSTVATLLKGEGYQVDELNLAMEEKVPDNTAALILAGPRKPLLPVEVERLKAWLGSNGRLMVMADPETRTGLEAMLQEYGVAFTAGMVIDPVARLYGGQPITPMVTQFAEHPITANLKAASFFPEARGLELKEDDKSGVARVRLISGAEKGWLESGDISSGSVAFDQGQDVKGPILMGAALTKEKQRLVVLGDSDFAADAYIDASGNMDLFMNMVRWLAEDESFIAIKPKEVADAGLELSAGQGTLLFWGQVVIIPLALMGSGVLVWWRRKRR